MTFTLCNLCKERSEHARANAPEGGGRFYMCRECVQEQFAYQADISAVVKDFVRLTAKKESRAANMEEFFRLLEKKL